MELWHALLLGIIQGLTEWLPLSSSGHLAVAQIALGKGSMGFDIVLHLATMLVVLLYFRGELSAILREWAAGIAETPRAGRKALVANAHRRLGWYIVLATVPTALVGYLLSISLAPIAFSSALLVGMLFIATGGFLALTAVRPKDKHPLRARISILVGLAQGIAVLPGLSRSGWTIGTALLAGVRRLDAARFSFLILFPAVLGALLLRLGEVVALAAEDLSVLIAGGMAAAFVGYASLSLLMSFLRRGGLHWFAPYCLLMGCALVACGLL
ncbi:MAG: undecaprenyl-diphosphate phosphatase [Candidatus Thermoplasmatota archaeon]